ncbi:MAG: DNA-protecting protein DprA [Deltaproteobacteria bacterium]|nr:DNA-protecting protein DprA [Deltaproteobacteria bacterium]
MQDDLKYWLALRQIEGVGNVNFKTLLDAVGSPQEVFRSSAHTLRMITGIGPKTAAAIKAFTGWREMEKEIERAGRLNVSIITCRDPLYPQDLLNIYDFPPFLYVRGQLDGNDINIAVVGSRMASTYGTFSTERLCRELALKGITTVSGLARGIDAAAHRGALAGKGRTIAVLGCGADIVYPPENEKLFEEIAAHGAIITEFPFGTPPNGPNFPARNRIISGISLGVVVVEAGYKSGSLITARIALEQGREVFAVPGSIDAAGSKGTNKLLKEGAKLVENTDDILEEVIPRIKSRLRMKAASAETMHQQKGAETKIPPSVPGTVINGNEENTLLQLISAKPVSVDGLIAATGFKAGEIQGFLLNMELRGLIRQLPGKLYIRKKE